MNKASILKKAERGECISDEEREYLKNFIKKVRQEAYEEGKKDGVNEYEKGLEKIKEIAQGMRDDQKEFGAFLSEAARNLPE